MTLSDTEARRRALNTTQSFCVTAPAGSGKTELLTQRFLALLATVNRPEEVLAITFTRKAAAEMQERVLEKLASASKGDPVTEPHEQVTRDLASKVLARSRDKQWVLGPEQLNLRTIDGLCAMLARQMPVLSGLGGNVDVTDQAGPLFDEAVAGLMEQLGEGGDTGLALRALLLHFDNDWSRVRELLVRLLDRRGDWAGQIGQHHSPAASAEAVARGVASLVGQVLSEAHAELGEAIPRLEALTAFSQGLAPGDSLRLGTQPDDLEAWQSAVTLLLTAGGDWRKPGGINKKLGFLPRSEEKADMVALLDALALCERQQPLLAILRSVRGLPVAEREDTGWALVLHLSRLLPVLMAELLLVFQRHGTVDHTHIALAASAALGDDEAPTDLALRLDYQISHLLIDEFQDTSDQQAELVRRLTRDWAAHNVTDAAPRTVFIVGDGMQSIYGFRHANVGLFLRARDRGIGDLRLEPLALTRNFRSQAGIVDWVNGAFSRLFPETDDSARGRVSHVMAESTRASLPGAAVRCDVFSRSPWDDVAESEEAKFIAATIAELRADDGDASVAILLRAKRHAEPVIKALAMAGIPFVGRGLDSLARRPAVTDVLSLCQWLANPADNIAGLALLRQPGCGLLLPDIAALVGHGAYERVGPFDLMGLLHAANTGVIDGLSAEGELRCRHLLAVLSWANARRDRLSLAVWIEQIWLRLGANLVLQSGDLQDVGAVFGLLRDAESCGVGLNIEWLQQRVGQLFAEHAAVPGAVEIMTLHKAKGLQFDLVFLPGLARPVRGNDRELLRWHLHLHPEAERETLLIAADDRLGPGERSLYNFLNLLQKDKDEAELRRLLYVGVTRARQRVFLTATVDIETGSDADAVEIQWPSAGTPLGILKPVVESDLGIHAEGEDEIAQTEVAQSEKPLSSGLMRRLSSQTLSALADKYNDAVSPSGSPVSGELPAQGNRVDRIVGIAVHRCLELLADTDLVSAATRLPDTLEMLEPALAAVFNAEGLSGEARSTALGRCQRILQTALSDERCRWLLLRHPGGHNELEVMVLSGDNLDPAGASATVKHIIDRTFVDEASGIRWIIDYKTSEPGPDETKSDFLAREREHYLPQMQRYSDVLADFDQPPRLLKTALYFPAIAEWLELDR